MKRSVKGPRPSNEQRRFLAGQSTSRLWQLIIEEAGYLAGRPEFSTNRKEELKRARFLYYCLLEARRRSGKYDARQLQLF